MEKLAILPQAEPFFKPGNKVGCLLVHGFTGAPQEMRELGERLAAQGYTVHGPRLTHHGTHPADMNRSLWRDWYFSALDGYHLLKGSCDIIIPIGLSMGGATVLLLSAWEEVRAVVSMAAPIVLAEDWRLRFTRQLAAVYPYDPPLTAEWRDTWGPPNGRASYASNPVYAIAELSDYLPVVRQHLSEVKAPALLIHAADDLTVPPMNVNEIYRLLGSEQKEKHIFDDGSHVLTEGIHKELIFELVLDFVQRQVKNS